MTMAMNQFSNELRHNEETTAGATEVGGDKRNFFIASGTATADSEKESSFLDNFLNAEVDNDFDILDRSFFAAEERTRTNDIDDPNSSVLKFDGTLAPLPRINETAHSLFPDSSPNVEQVAGHCGSLAGEPQLFKTLDTAAAASTTCEEESLVPNSKDPPKNKIETSSAAAQEETTTLETVAGPSSEHTEATVASGEAGVAPVARAEVKEHENDPTGNSRAPSRMVSMASIPNLTNQQEQQQQQQTQDYSTRMDSQHPPPGSSLGRSGANKLTPYDSLKELVKKKRKLAETNNGGASVSGGSSFSVHGSSNNVLAGATVEPPSKDRKIDFGSSAGSGQRQTLTHSVSAPAFKPSNFLRQALYSGSSSNLKAAGGGSGMQRNKSLSSFAGASLGNRQNHTADSSGGLGSRSSFTGSLFNFNQVKRPSKPKESQLHRACCNGDGVAILQFLQSQPFVAANSSQLKTLKKRYNPMFRIMETRRVKETYTYPINLALKYNASSEALRELVKLAPQVLTQPDGPNKEISLHVLLKYKSPDVVALVDTILLKYPTIARWKDRQFNTPLHVACNSGCPLDVVRHLCIMYPDALFACNFHGLTPLDLAYRASSGGACADESVINYLWEAAAEQAESIMEQG